MISKIKNISPAYWLVTAISIVIGVAGFLVPPRGVIDGSCLIFIGSLMLFTVICIALSDGRNAKVSFDADDKRIEIETNESNK